jgi:hypothetical protein
VTAQPKPQPSLEEAMARIDELERLVGNMHVQVRSLMGLLEAFIDDGEDSTLPPAAASPPDLLGELIAKRGT